MMKRIIAAIFSLTVALGLPTNATTTPTSTLMTTSVNLMPNPCGGEIDMTVIPSETELQEGLAELLPNAVHIESAVSDMKSYMGVNRIQSPMLRNIAEKTAPVKFPSNVFPYATNNYFSDDMFSKLYRNVSMLEIYYSGLKVVENNHDDDNDSEILTKMADVIEAAQKMRCHLQVILRFYEQSIPSVDFKVDDSKIDSKNRSSRYFKHYQVQHMTKIFVESLTDFLSKL